MNWLSRLRSAFGRGAPEGRPAPDRALSEGLGFLQRYCDEATFSSAAGAVRREFGLFHRWNASRQRNAELRQLAANPELAAVYLFHGDGFIREAALNALAAPIRLPVVAYELMRRMNDWAPEVRAAAWSAIARCFRQTDPSVLAPAAWIVLLDARSWGRWQEGYFRLLDELFEHPGLFSALIMRLLNESRNGSGTVFRALCQSTEMDRCLVDLAARARQPHLRAGALNCISSGKVVWPLGKSRKVWVDKSLGEYKVVADYGSRPLSVHLDLESILEQALRDRSAAVRKEALDALILHRRDPRLRVLISHCLEAFAKDPRPSVRSRLEYLERNLPKLP